ncbi:MAG TPA: hypothetical protein PK156_23290 [Polyangium sp.]|nr:hypothetical protein [Polyangium sp.]
MLAKVENPKLRSPGTWSRFLAWCVGITALSGCIIVDDGDSRNYPPPPPPPPPADPMLVNIDTNEILDAIPGDGVGVFVEYSEGGHYRVWTTCDTDTSGVICTFDVFTSVDTSSTVNATIQDNLEGADSITVQQGAGTVDLHFETDNDYDAVEIDVTPGAILRVEAFVDNVSDPRFIFWVGDGVLHQGAPTNPIDFFPTVP